MALHYCYYSTFFWCWAASIYNPRPPPLAKCMPHPHTGAHLAFRAIDFYMRTQFSICRYYSQTLEWHVWYTYYVIFLVFARTKNNRRRIFQRYVYIYIFNTRRTRIHLFMSNQCERVSDPSNPSARTPITPHTHSDRGPVSGKFLDFPHMYSHPHKRFYIYYTQQGDMHLGRCAATIVIYRVRIVRLSHFGHMQFGCPARIFEED